MFGIEIMPLSSIIIIGIWAAVLISRLAPLLEPATLLSCKARLPPAMAPFVLAMPFVVFGIGAFRAPHSPFLVPKLAALITARTGRKSYEMFLSRLKPMLLFGVGGILDGASQLRSCLQLGDSFGIHARGWFFVAGGTAFILMHCILKYRKVPAV